MNLVHVSKASANSAGPPVPKGKARAEPREPQRLGATWPEVATDILGLSSALWHSSVPKKAGKGHV